MRERKITVTVTTTRTQPGVAALPQAAQNTRQRSGVSSAIDQFGGCSEARAQGEGKALGDVPRRQLVLDRGDRGGID